MYFILATDCGIITTERILPANRISSQTLTRAMDPQVPLRILREGGTVVDGSEEHKAICDLSERAIRITSELNTGYKPLEERRRLFFELIGKDDDGTFRIFPPFTTDCGMNITVGRNVFINSGCRFQDQGGITIGNDVLIGHNVIIATLNHDMAVSRRGDLIGAPVTIGDSAWIGSGSIILPGVTVGRGAVIGAGSVVTKDVPERAVVVGVPAKQVRTVDE